MRPPHRRRQRASQAGRDVACTAAPRTWCGKFSASWTTHRQASQLGTLCGLRRAGACIEHARPSALAIPAGWRAAAQARWGRCWRLCAAQVAQRAAAFAGPSIDACVCLQKLVPAILFKCTTPAAALASAAASAGSAAGFSRSLEAQRTCLPAPARSRWQTTVRSILMPHQVSTSADCVAQLNWPCQGKLGR